MDFEHEGALPGSTDQAPRILVPAECTPGENPLVSAACERAAQVLRNCSYPSGLRASGRAYGHQQIWVRDSMIALLGGCLIADATVRSSLLAGLANFRRHQTPSGLIPNHVDLEGQQPNFRAYADGGLWFVIGSTLMDPNFASIARTLEWYACQDVDHTGLLSIQESSDWEDLFCTRGKGLYVNCLHVLALQKAAALAASLGKGETAALYRRRAEAARSSINQYLWYAGDGDMLRYVAASFSTPNLQHDSLGRHRWIPQKRILVDAQYYLSYVSFREVGEWFDSFGNLMAILAGVASAEQSSRILDFIAEHDLARHPIKAIYPPVQPGDPDWRDYYGTLNLPNHYHNGGTWPFLGGFYVAALTKAGRHDEARAALGRLAQLNSDGDFNEWHYGENAEPRGVEEQAWSAGMFLYAAGCVRSRTVPFLA